MYALGDTPGNPTSRHGSSASHVSTSEHRLNRSTAQGSTASTSRSAGKRSRSTVPSSELVDGHQFLSLLFDRQDCLLTISESEDEEDTDDDLDNTLDPRLFSEGGKKPIGSPMDTSASRLPSPERAEKRKNVRSIHATHLSSRQPIIKTIRIHPNLNLHNLFGNLPFSSGVRANNYPEEVQETQVNNLFLPSWAMMTVSTRPDPGTIKLAFPPVLQEAMAMLDSGTPLELVIETHPNVAALFDEDEFNNAGILSRWAARMVHSLMLRGTCCILSSDV